MWLPSFRLHTGFEEWRASTLMLWFFMHKQDKNGKMNSFWRNCAKQDKAYPDVEWAFNISPADVMSQSPKDHNGHGSHCFKNSTNQSNRNKEVGNMPGGHRVQSYLKILFPRVLHFQRQQTHFKFINHLLHLYFLSHIKIILNLLCLHNLATAKRTCLAKSC